MIPAREWNRLRAFLARALPIPGYNARATRSARGITLLPDLAAFRWLHPWHTTAAWDPNEKTWLARIRPGFLDGDDPTMPGPDGKPVGLLDEPRLRLPLAPWTFAPPPYFSRLGVRDPGEGLSLEGDKVTFTDESWRDDFRPPARTLARCDILLSKARAALSGAVTFSDPGATGTTATFTPAYITTLLETVGSRGRIGAVPLYTPPRTPTLLDRLMGTYEEPQEDTIHLSTVWLLSPPGDTTGHIGPDWTPYVQHRCFWNLAHVAPVPAPPAIPRPITLTTGLAGGFADQIFNQLLAPGNDAAANIAAAIQTISPAGKFHSV